MQYKIKVIAGDLRTASTDAPVPVAQRNGRSGTDGEARGSNGAGHPRRNGNGYRLRPDGAFPFETSPLIPLAGEDDNAEAASRKALEILGLRWSMLILREVFAGSHRFGELHDRLGISRKMLTRRLYMLVSYGILERRRLDSGLADRYEYWPTPKGHDLYPALASLARWGERHLTATP